MTAVTTHHVTDDELEACRRFAERLQSRARRRRWNEANARKRSLEQLMADQLNGFAGELAFCRWLGIEWAPDIDAFHARPDVLGVFEVRTNYKPAGGLVIRSTELPAPGRCFVLVTGNVHEPPRAMTVRGYLWANHFHNVEERHIQSRQPMLDGGTATYVDQAALRRPTPEVRARMLAYTRSATA